MQLENTEREEVTVIINIILLVVVGEVMAAWNEKIRMNLKENWKRIEKWPEANFEVQIMNKGKVRKGTGLEIGDIRG